VNAKQSYWIIKAREKLEDGTKGWHWHRYLRAPVSSKKVWRDWGGIESHISQSLIRTEFRKGDLALCYQVDRREILGFTRVASVDGVSCKFDLEPSASAYLLKKPLRIKELRATGSKPKGFTAAGRGTVARLAADELKGIIAEYPEEEDLPMWFKDSGFRDGSRPDVGHLGNAEFKCENVASTPYQIEKTLATLEKELARRNDVYVQAKVRAIIRRDGPFIRALKKKYKHKCQYPNCKASIPMRNGGHYCEVAHILAASEGGKANRINLLVLCPNHHKMFDYGKVTVIKNTKRVLKMKLNDKIVSVRR